MQGRVINRPPKHILGGRTAFARGKVNKVYYILYINHNHVWEVNNMAVKIRLRRMGAKKTPFYRVVVADSRYPRNGRFIEEVGTYNPLTDPATVNIDAEAVKKWISNGAQPTDTVKALLKKSNII